MTRVDVLGIEYTIRRVKTGQDEYMEKMRFGGYCDSGKKEIFILDLATTPEWEHEPTAYIMQQEKETMRHELIHAFLNESGLRWSSVAPETAWAKNEEMVDWFAIQMPRLLKAFKDADCL